MRDRIKILVVLLLMAGPTAGSAVSAGERIATEHNKKCPPVKREIYRLRHWQWSGIFPFEGGFIPDPHFVCSNKASFPPSVAALLHDPSASFQIVDINPFFKDTSKEIIFAVQVSGNVLYELTFDYRHDFNVRQGIAEAYPDVRVFPYKGKLAVLSQLAAELRGYYFISLPLRSGEVMQFHPAGSQEFEKVSDYFRHLPPSGELKDYFCGRGVYDGTGNNAFIAYYQKYRNRCDEKNQVGSPADYDEFWASGQE